MTFQKLVLAIFFYVFLNTVTKTEGGLITDFRKFREYTNIRLNDADENSVQRIRQSKNTDEQDDPSQLVKQLEKSHKPRFTEKSSDMTMTIKIITTEKSKRRNINEFGVEKKNTKSLNKLIRYDDRSVKLLAAIKKNTGPKDINGKPGNKSQPTAVSQFLSTNCGTRRSVVTITRVGDQTTDPNRITMPFVAFTPRTRTQPQLTSTFSKRSTKKWGCDEDVEDEPVTNPSCNIDKLWEDITLPTRLPKYPTPIDPATKWFLKMTSTNGWRRMTTDKCTKPF
ncbi:hypothetical protein QTP88_003779 [Uroleucon formosanum]